MSEFSVAIFRVVKHPPDKVAQPVQTEQYVALRAQSAPYPTLGVTSETLFGLKKKMSDVSLDWEAVEQTLQGSNIYTV